MQVKVNIIYDFTLGVGTHNLLIPPAVPAPTPTFAIEIPATQMWTVGFLIGQNKFTNKGSPVFHKGVFIAVDGHNQGMLIPDITIPFVNVWYAVMWPFSSRKIVFSASTVQMNGTATACSQLFGLPPLPQLACGDPVSLPFTFSMITFTNTLTVGMTLMDLFIGIVTIVVSIVVDVVLYALGNKFPNFFAKGFAGKLAGKLFASKTAQEVFKGIIGKLVPGADIGETIKRGVGALTDLGISALKGSPSFKLVALGNPDGGPFGLEVEIAPPTPETPNPVTVRANLGGHQVANQGTVNRWGTPTSVSPPPATPAAAP